MPKTQTTRLSLYFLLFVICAFAYSSGCSGTAEGDCETIAQKQCELWTSCKCNNEPCQSPGHQYQSMEMCTESLVKSCRSQASSINDSDTDVGGCLEAVSNFTCPDIQRAAAQDREPRPEACRYFY